MGEADKIKTEIVELGGYFRRSCGVCGGWTEKEVVNVVYGPNRGSVVCDRCVAMSDQDRDKMLEDNKIWRENNMERRKEYFKAYTKAKFHS